MADKSVVFTPPTSVGPIDQDSNVVKVPMDEYPFGFRKAQQQKFNSKNKDHISVAHVKSGN